jgi:uncharacterized protein (TIGR00255 family)
MTGFGDARQLEGEHLISAEVRTVNNRYLKINLRVPDAFASIESRIEKLLRDAVARGTVSLTLRVDLAGRASRYRIDHDVVVAYYEQMGSLSDELNLPPSKDIGYLLQLPGVISEHNAEEIDADAQWPLIEHVVEEALSRLNAFRVREGESMRRELSTHCGLVRDQLQVVSEQAPHVVVQYRDRLRERVAQLLKDAEVSISHADLIREVSIFADRCDINEEILRLKSHLDQFEDCLTEGQSAGRKLEFLCQEMFREINTIGSKSNSIDIAHAVVEMKGTVEKLREIVQNVE